jgi:hypothetical protein
MRNSPAHRTWYREDMTNTEFLEAAWNDASRRARANVSRRVYGDWTSSLSESLHEGFREGWTARFGVLLIRTSRVVMALLPIIVIGLLVAWLVDIRAALSLSAITIVVLAVFAIIRDR